MPKLHPLPVKKVIKTLKNNGFELDRIKRHHVYKKNTGKEILTAFVSHPHKKDISVAVIKSIIMQARKPRKEFY